MAAPKGFRPPNAGKGRRKGALNKTTVAAKEAFQLAFDVSLGGWQGLGEWAKANPTEFYRIYGRLIPVDTQVSGGISLVWPLARSPLDE